MSCERIPWVPWWATHPGKVDYILAQFSWDVTCGMLFGSFAWMWYVIVGPTWLNQTSHIPALAFHFHIITISNFSTRLSPYKILHPKNNERFVFSNNHKIYTLLSFQSELDYIQSPSNLFIGLHNLRSLASYPKTNFYTNHQIQKKQNTSIPQHLQL